MRFSRDKEEEDDYDEDDRGLDAWERTYADERSWESLQEDESGLLRPIDNKVLYHAQYHRCLRTKTAARIQKGLIRYLYIVIDLSENLLDHVPAYGHREVLLLYSALSTCDPGDILETIQKCKTSKIRCSVVGLSLELYICKHLCQETCGSYYVALDEGHLKELLFEHAPPPPAMASMIKMGFPQRAAKGANSIVIKRTKLVWATLAHNASLVFK